MFYLFKETMFARWAWNTLWIATASTAISLFAGVLAGYSLSRLRFPGSGTFGISIFITYLVPPTLLFIPLASVIANLRLLDSPWALILTYPTILVPFSAWLLMGYFKTIPRELEECARIDGATRLQAMTKIIPAARHAGHSLRRYLLVHGCRGTSSFTRWCSFPRRSRRPSRSAW